MYINLGFDKRFNNNSGKKNSFKQKRQKIRIANIFFSAHTRIFVILYATIYMFLIQIGSIFQEKDVNKSGFFF